MSRIVAPCETRAGAGVGAGAADCLDGAAGAGVGAGAADCLDGAAKTLDGALTSW